MKFNESYKTAAFSTANITEADSVQLQLMSEEENSVVAERHSGFFIKLFSEVKLNEHEQLSPELKALLVEAARQGFGCVEIDSDAETVDGAPVFEW